VSTSGGVEQKDGYSGGAMRITKVYTRTGDKGRTRLAGGQTVSKDSLRIEAYGTVDELNSAVGLVRAYNRQIMARVRGSRTIEIELQRMQNRLFDIGALLAILPRDRKRFKKLPVIKPEEVRHLERLMDGCQKKLRPLKEFILPTGSLVSASLHLSRTICRRAERLCVRLNAKESVDSEVLRYLNRLSDALFVLARWMGQQQRVPERLWDRKSKSPS
jgi:cob(I)alamin adenosyltransferase